MYVLLLLIVGIMAMVLPTWFIIIIKSLYAGFKTRLRE